MSRPLRFFLSSHGASPYGAERVLLILAEGLAARGHHVTLEIPNPGPALERARELAGVEVWMSERPRLPRNLREAIRYLLKAPAAVLRLRRRIRRDRFDVVWVNSLYNPPAALAARLARAPVVWYLHERCFRGPAGPLAAWLVRALAHEPVAVSRFVADTFEAAPWVRDFRVLHAQTDLPEPTAHPEGGPFTVGYLGQLEDRKRPIDVLRAIAGLPDVHGLVVGGGKREDAVRAAVADLGLDERVALPGFQTDVGRWYGRMSCVVIPSPDEACPLVAMEAMSAGRPVIAADHGGLPEVLGDAALLFPLGDIPALRRCIARLRDDPDLRFELARRGVERASIFDRERWLDEAVDIARSAARQARRQR